MEQKLNTKLTSSSYVCPSNSKYPKKPDYDTFAKKYSEYASAAAEQIGISTAVVLTQWYQEWGIPINNPGFQGGSIGEPVGKCGTFPVYATLDDGVEAYCKQINKRYVGGKDAFNDIFGNKTIIKAAYEDGFKGGLKAFNVQTDDNKKVNVVSERFVGGNYACNEALGASPWNAGHYMRASKGDTYPGRRLNALLNDAGW